MTNLNNWLEKIEGLKTEKGAMNRLNQVMSVVVESESII
jgi:hypothetical protein